MNLETRLRQRWQRMHSAQTGSRILPHTFKIWDVPTRFGWSILLLLVVMFIWSANHQLNLGYALIFLILICWLWGWVMVAEQLAELEITTSAGSPVWAGENARFFVQITEKKGRERGQIIIRNEYSESRTDYLAAGESKQLMLQEPTWQRGWHKMNAFSVLSTYPAGAFLSWQWIYQRAEVLVYPHPLGDLPLPWQVHSGQGKLIGAAAGEDELSHLRPYHNGDPLSRVAWKRYGRGELLLKQFSGEGAPRLVLDFAALNGDLEQKLSQLAKWIVEAEAQNLSYALHLPNQIIDFGTGQEQREKCLRALALFPHFNCG